MLIDSINNLFENFVNASVAAIEQRDATTSGHSFRVADLSVALARVLPQARRGDLIRFDPTDARLRELRYASLLRDFGKVGVREHVLMKAKKLYDWEFSELRYRLALAEQTLRADAAESILKLHERGQVDNVKVAEIKVRHAEDSERLQQFMATVIRSNEPSLLPDECKENLDALRLRVPRRRGHRNAPAQRNSSRGTVHGQGQLDARRAQGNRIACGAYRQFPAHDPVDR